MNEQVYYIEQWRNPIKKNHFGFEILQCENDFYRAVARTRFFGFITVAYFRIKLKKQ